MRTKLLLAALLAVVSVQAELLIGKPLVVPEGQVAFISMITADQTRDSDAGTMFGIINIGHTITGNVPHVKGGDPVVLAGPATFTITNRAAMSVKRYASAGIVSLAIPAGWGANIGAPEGKTLKFFRSPFGPIEGVEFFDGPISISSRLANCVLYGGEEFEGPATVWFERQSYDRVFTYQLTENDTTASAPSIGRVMLSVDKSNDLQSWTPIVERLTDKRESEFFRLRIQK